MSTRDDATLSPEERAAFARIEAQAVSQDPRLGPSIGLRIGRRIRRMLPVLGRGVRGCWVGPLLVVAGIALVALGLATSLAVAVVGLAFVVAGAVLLAGMIRRKVELMATRAAPTRPDDPR